MKLEFSGTVEEVKREMNEYLCLFSTQPSSVDPKPEKSKGGRPKKEEHSAALPLPEIEKPVTPVIPSDEEVQKALVAVNDKFGIDKAIECLKRFSVSRGRELLPEQKAPFIFLCNEALAGK